MRLNRASFWNKHDRNAAILPLGTGFLAGFADARGDARGVDALFAEELLH
jgi:hypothetical protein